jgi:hypothetical protein
MVSKSAGRPARLGEIKMRIHRKHTVLICALLSLSLVVSSVLFSSEGLAAPPDSDYTGTHHALSGLEAIEELTAEPADGVGYDGYLVKLKSGANMNLARIYSNGVIGGEIAVVDRPEDALKFADASDVEIIEPNYKVSLFAFPQTDPVDKYYISPTNDQWGIKYVNANAAWRAGYRGQGVNVAIIDTGIVNGHEDLSRDKILGQYDWVNEDLNAEDDNMHGSVVGGIIAADINNIEMGTTNGIGMAGITDKVNLIIHKSLDSRGGSAIYEGGVSDVLYALYHILDDGNGVDVVNLSLGHEGYVGLEDEVIQKIIAKGTIVVAAAGNNGADAKGRNAMNFPAGYANVIGVGSVGDMGYVSSFSTKNSSVDIAAPGEYMVGLQHGTTRGYLVRYYQGSPLNGTSFSSPVVAASAAIAKQRDKSIDAGAFLTALKATSRPAGPAGYDTSYGNGILDINNLVNYLNTKAIKVKFDANGGKVASSGKNVWAGGKYGKLPTAKRSKYGFGGWYTKRKGGTEVTSLSRVPASSGITLYAHWQGGTTLYSIKPSVGKLSPVFSYKKTSYKLTLTRKQASVKITPTKSYKSAKMQIKVGKGKYKKVSAVKVKVGKGKQVTVSIKLSAKGAKTKTYKIKVKRRK